MSERGSIGQILVSVGRIGEDDVAEALSYQRDHGGYFGEALLACGLVSQAELEWGLASQFDLPYVFPEADSIDYEAAELVSPEWALAHLTLPIMKTASTLTVIVESPIKAEAVTELRSRTDLEVELALASPSKIRELIRAVYARASPAEEEERRAPLELADALDATLQAATPRLGISVRGPRAWAWWEDGGTVRRRPLSGDWAGGLERALDPGPAGVTRGQARASWSGRLSRAGVTTPVDVSFLSDESGAEYLFEPVSEPSELEERFPLPAAGVLSEIRMLARTGKARFVVSSDPPALGHAILPHLPILLLDASWRSIYVNAFDQAAAAEAFSHRLSSDPASWPSELETLRAFRFDVATVDLSGGEADWTGPALDIAPVAFLLWEDGIDVRPAYEEGIRWRLHIEQDEESRLEWLLEPLHI